jgi:hypothetical protein
MSCQMLFKKYHLNLWKGRRIHNLCANSPSCFEQQYNRRTKSTVNFNVSVLTSFTSLWQISEVNNFERRKIYFGSSFQSDVCWLHCFWTYGTPPRDIAFLTIPQLLKVHHLPVALQSGNIKSLTLDPLKGFKDPNYSTQPGIFVIPRGVRTDM